MGVLMGRTRITTSEAVITRDNLLDALNRAKMKHNTNKADIDYLYNYYKGKQPVLRRKKAVRPEITNRIVVNMANEIVSFKVGYLMGEPVQYVSRQAEDVSDSIDKLNDAMADICKVNLDHELAEWFTICGTAYRMALPSDGRDDDVPFRLYTLDPRDTFVVYSSDVDHRPIMAVKTTVDDDNIETDTVYTAHEYFEVRQGEIIRHEAHALGDIPIIEYPANGMLGAFEIALPMLDLLNELESSRADGIQQFVQSYMKFINCDIDEETFEKFKQKGLIKIKSLDGQSADVDLISKELDQAQVQTFIDDVKSDILTICGVPNRGRNNSRYSTSDTGVAVELRDGHADSETRTKNYENCFKVAERRMLKLVLRYCEVLGDFKLSVRDIDIKFTRRNYEGIQAKSQVLITMLEHPQIHPRLAFAHCGLFSDPETAYAMSAEYYEEQLAKQTASLNAESGIPTAGGSSGDGDVGSVTGENADENVISGYVTCNGKHVRPYSRG